MLTVNWNIEDGWEKPYIHPIRPIHLHPAAKVLHYAAEVRMRMRGVEVGGSRLEWEGLVLRFGGKRKGYNDEGFGEKSGLGMTMVLRMVE